MEFQERAVAATRERLPARKSLIGFVGGPWTLLNYATGGKPRMSLQWKTEYLNEVIVPLLARNIDLQLKAGAEKVMILDSGLDNMSENYFKQHYVNLLQPLITSKTGYYTRHLNKRCISTLYKMGWSGIGIDSSVSLSNTFKKYTGGFIQGNFNEKHLLLSELQCRNEITKWLDSLDGVDTTGWVCGVGHGIIKETPEENVKMFVQLVREHFK